MVEPVKRGRWSVTVSLLPGIACIILFVYAVWQDPAYRKRRVDIGPDAATITSGRKP